MSDPFKELPPDKRAAADKLIREILKTHKGGQTFGFGSVETMNQRALRAVLGNVTDREVMVSIARMDTKATDLVAEFVLQLTMLRKEPPRTDQHPLRFFVPLNIRIDGFKAQVITFHGQRLRFSTWRAVAKNIGSKKMQIATLGLHPRVRDSVSVPDDSLCVVSRTWGHDASDGWQNLEPVIDALRGLLIFTMTLYRFTINMGAGLLPQPIPPPPWLLVIGGKKPEALQFLREPPDRRTVAISKESFAAFIKNCRQTKRRPPSRSTNELLADALRLYAQAMDERLDHRRLLGLWQLAEAITLASPGNSKTSDVARKLNWFLDHQWQKRIVGMGYLLDVIGQHRNNIVHRGLSTATDSNEVAILKAAVEGAMQWLSRWRNKLPTRAHLEYFYQLRTRPESEMATVADTLRALRLIRQSQKTTAVTPPTPTTPSVLRSTKPSSD